MQKIKYITNRELMAEIQRSKATYCHFIAPEYTTYDTVVTSTEMLTPEFIGAALQTKMTKLAKAQIATDITSADVVFRVMTDVHLPEETDEKRRRKSSTGGWIPKTNFPPFQHYVLHDDILVEVGRSHWRGDLESGNFCPTHGKMTNRLASMFLLLVEQYSRRGNWRGYCCDQTTEALTQRGWLGIDEINEEDTILSYEDGKLKWSKIKSIYRGDYEGKMFRLTGRGLDALITPGHKFLTDDGLKPVEHLRRGDQIILDPWNRVDAGEIDFHGTRYADFDKSNEPTVDYKGRVWCVETEYGSFMARRNGYVYLSGNSYVSDMRGQALVQLSQVGLQFDESRSDNPFAWYTQIIKNCLSADVMILTREHGSVPIAEVSEQDVHLLDGNGEWVRCHIHDCGEQETVKLNFFGGWEKVTIRSTMQHGWIVNGERIETREFVEHPYRMKDVLIDDLRPAKLIKDQEQYRRGVIHGLIYGDGSAAPRCKKFYFMRLCHPKHSLAAWLDAYPKSYAQSYNGDPTYYIAQAWCDLKAFPDHPGESLDYLLGFLRGWFAADGCVSDEGTNSVAKLTAPEPAYHWLKKWGPLVGWHVRGYSVVENHSGFISNQVSLNIHLKKQSMDLEDFLHAKHHERWQQTLAIKKPKAWSIYPGSRNQDYERTVERVYCPTVDTTHSFALTCGIHSGNSFRRTLLLERRNQDIRDDLLIMAGAIPSFTRQVDDELEQRNEKPEDAEPGPPKRRGRRPKSQDI